MIAAIAAATCRTAKAQADFVAIETTAEQPNDPKHPFILPAQSNETNEALEDFQRFSKRGIWEKAFKSLDKVVAASSKGLVGRGDGVMIPARLLIRQTLAELPADGKTAYRLFHDAEAKALLEEARGPAEAEKLAAIVSAHLITSVGDVAADRLGDLYFEQGEMPRAADAWQAILNHLPESSIPRCKLLVKAGTALARAGRWTEFAAVKRELDERHSGETVEIGGQETSATEHLAALAKMSGQEPSVDPTQPPLARDPKLPQSNDPLWQFKLVGGKEGGDPNAGVMMMDPWGRQVRADMVMPAVVDDTRLYGNLLGYELAIDLATGKLLWRTGKFHDLGQKTRQNQMVSSERYNFTLAGDRLWSVTRDPAQIGQHGGQFVLTSRETATGKESLNSKSIKELQTWNFSGRPLVDGERIYVAGFKQNQNTELHVLALNAKDGKPIWTSSVGTHQVDQINQNYYSTRSSQPMLIKQGDRLFIETHAGAMVQLDANTGTMNWAVVYDSEMPNTGYNYYQPVKVLTSGEPRFADGKLYFKGMNSPRLVALNPEMPSLVWKRPVASSAMLIGIDAERVYMSGEEVLAYELKTQKLLWSNKVPLGTSWTRPLMTQNRLFQFTPRGIYEIDKVSGQVVRLFRGADLDSLGGTIILTPHALVTVSNLAITAYSIDGSPAAAPDKAAPDKAVKPDKKTEAEAK